MQPSCWQPPVDLSIQEEHIVARIRRAKLFVFLRHHRHELFDEAFRTANWRPFTGQASGDIRPSPPHNWRLRSFCKHIQEFPTTK